MDHRSHFPPQQPSSVSHHAAARHRPASVLAMFGQGSSHVEGGDKFRQRFTHR